METRRHGDVCENCIFWRDALLLDEKPTTSDCQRFPPSRWVEVVRGETNGIMVGFRNREGHPQTFRSHWCGEWKSSAKDR